MESPAEFTDLAQIAITLAGFTGIIGVFQQRGGLTLTEREKLHIINLIQSTAIVVFLAFVPAWLSRFPATGFDVWTWSLRILFVFHVLAWIIGSVNLKRFFVILGSLPKIEKGLIFLVLLPTGAGLTITEGILVFSGSSRYVAFVYEAALLYFLCLAFFNFVALLLKQDYAIEDG